MYSRVIVAPPVEPITLAEVKLDRAIDHALHDDLLRALIHAARDYVEEYCGVSLVTQTREVGFDAFGSQLEIPYGPVQEIVSIEYLNGDSVSTPFTGYQIDTGGRIARVDAAYGTAWPTALGALNAITVRYIAGFPPIEGSPTDYTGNVPGAIKQAMRLMVGTWYENRESAIVGATVFEQSFGITALLNPYRVRTGMA